VNNNAYCQKSFDKEVDVGLLKQGFGLKMSHELKKGNLVGF
jgi:hypothetical protein